MKIEDLNVEKIVKEVDEYLEQSKMYVVTPEWRRFDYLLQGRKVEDGYYCLEEGFWLFLATNDNEVAKTVLERYGEYEYDNVTIDDWLEENCEVKYEFFVSDLLNSDDDGGCLTKIDDKFEIIIDLDNKKIWTKEEFKDNFACIVEETEYMILLKCNTKETTVDEYLEKQKKVVWVDYYSNMHENIAYNLYANEDYVFCKYDNNELEVTFNMSEVRSEYIKRLFTVKNATSITLAKEYDVELVKDVLDHIKNYKNDFIEITSIVLRTGIDKYRNLKGFSYDIYYKDLICIEYEYLFDISKCENYENKLKDEELFTHGEIQEFFLEYFSDEVEHSENELLWDLQEKFKIEV